MLVGCEPGDGKNEKVAQEPGAGSAGKGLAAIAEMPLDSRQLTEEAVEILREEAERNPAAAADWVVTLPPGANRDSCMEVVFTVWGGKDAGSAMDFAKWNLTGMDLTVAAASIAESLAFAEGPDPALRVMALVAEPMARGLVAESIANGAAANDPAGTGRWVSSLSEPVPRAAALRALVEFWSMQDPVAAAAWVDSLHGGGEKAEASRILAGNWGSLAPRSAAEWLDARAGSVDFESSGVELAGSWAMVDPSGAERWALGHENANARPALIRAVAEVWVLNETSKAIDRASAIPDPALRREALLAAFDSLLAESPAAFDAWMQGHTGHRAISEAREVREESE